MAIFGLATDSGQMAKRSRRSAGLADPTRLPPFESKDADLTVIIETPKGSRNKYAHDPEERGGGRESALMNPPPDYGEKSGFAKLLPKPADF